MLRRSFKDLGQFEETRALLRRAYSTFLEHFGPSRHELDVAQTFQLSWKITPDPAKQVLRVMGELAPAPVPRAVLRKILEWPAQSELRNELGRALSELARLSLAEPEELGGLLNRIGSHHRVLGSLERRVTPLSEPSPRQRNRWQLAIP